MKFFFFFFLFIFSISLVSASLNLDKGHLDYSTIVGEESCLIVTLSSEDYSGKVKIRDVWRKDSSAGANLNKYELNASDLDLLIKYNKDISNFKNSEEIEICLSGNKPGDYRGSLIFTPESDTNVVVEVATWLLVNVEEASQESGSSQSGSSSSSGGSGGSGGGGSTITSQSEIYQEVKNENSSTSEAEDESLGGISAKITGNAINEYEDRNWPLTPIIVTITIMFLIALTFYIKRKSR